MTEGPDNCAGCGHERGMHALDYGPCMVPGCRCGAFSEED
jgi:hypothetical protein